MSYKLVVGLGNPGSEYAGTRHNMGFMLVERFLAGHRPERWEKVHTCNSFCYIGSFAGSKLILQLPQTDDLNGRIKVVSVAPLLGEAIMRIHEGKSVSCLFDVRS